MQKSVSAVAVVLCQRSVRDRDKVLEYQVSVRASVMSISSNKHVKATSICVILIGAIALSIACSDDPTENASEAQVNTLNVISSAQRSEKTPRVEADGTVHVGAFDLPESVYISEETRAALKHSRDVSVKEYREILKSCGSFDEADLPDMPAIRQCQAETFYKSAGYKRITDRYDVNIAGETIGGVYTEVFTPADGVVRSNEKRVLINLHSGGFYYGARYGGRVESIPIASIGKIKVISIDYRQAPEHQFPTASEDVAAVYRELLKDYTPESIGIYGCSAGGILTAQSIAWFLEEGLPTPGAVGMFCAAAPTAFNSQMFKWVRSDASHIGAALAGIDFNGLVKERPYFESIDRTAPLVSPGSYDEIMSKFPPSLLITGTRDLYFSNVIYTHAQLTRLGVEANLHVWEGMRHAFHSNPDLPESREAYNVIVNFFDKHLGR